MEILSTVIFAGLVLVVYVQWYVDRQLKRRMALDVPLQEVIAVTIWPKREYFLEALKLSANDFDAAPERVSTIRVRLQRWKSHYSGDVSFYNQNGLIIQKCEIDQFPTTSDQFPVKLGESTLLRKDREGEEPSLGSGPNEKLEVLLSQCAFIVRAKDGRFGIRNSGPFFESDLSDLLIPTRESDLAPFLDTFGRDDADFLLVTGHTRRYERDGRWATWQMSTVTPESISWMTKFLDKSPVKLND